MGNLQTQRLRRRSLGPVAIATMLMLLSCIAISPLWGLRTATDATSTGAKPQRNVILVLIDGLRWQEVFGGAEEALISKDAGGVSDIVALRKEYWRDGPEQRRAILMPFLWSTVAKGGQVIGNQRAGCIARVSNTFNFSYPGYSEMICGFADPMIDSNKHVLNPNVSVFEWLHGRPGFEGKVAAFGAWQTVAWIVNRERCGFPVNAGWEPLVPPPGGELSEREIFLNELKAQLPRRWPLEPDDAITFHSAIERLKRDKPRALWLTFGETDEFAHEGRYDLYLGAIRNTDALLRQLWETLQSMEQYRDNTTLIITTDHGRGSAEHGGLMEWRDHGEKVAGSQFVWCAIIGPDTPALGERRSDDANSPLQFTLSQVAATVAAAVGEDYAAAQPKAAKPLDGAVVNKN